MTTFYLIRHGQHIRREGDPSLTDLGRRQAQLTAQRLSRYPVDALFTSPLARARETAEVLSSEIGVAVSEDVRLRERANYGDQPGQTIEEFVAMWQRCNLDRTLVPEEGISAWANGARMEGWLREQYETRPQGSVVACSHGGTITDFLLNIFEQNPAGCNRIEIHPDIGNCSITIVAFDGRRFRLDQFASTDHLQ